MRLIAILAATAVVGVPLSASASPSYPSAIQSDLSLSYSLGTDHCIICHASNSGGIGTVVQPFGLAMKQAGLVLENTAALSSALSTLDSDMHDSDCDGVPDIQQLKAGRNPNGGPAADQYIDGSGRTHAATSCSGADGGGSDTPTVIIPEYGCGAQLAAGPVSGAGLSAVATLLGLTALSARRKRRGTPGRSR